MMARRDQLSMSAQEVTALLEEGLRAQVATIDADHRKMARVHPKDIGR